MLAVTDATAAGQRSFVSGTGTDVGTCTLTAPCRTFGYAISQTISGGEILALDSAGYGPVNIDRSVSITGPDGTYAGITATSGNGVTMNTAGVNVALRGLTINGIGGANGILVTNGSSLRIENCTVSGFTGSSTAGINIGAPAKVVISNTVVTGNNIGIVLDGGTNADISRVRAVDNSAHGIAMVGTSNATTNAVVSDSIVSSNGVFGLIVVGVGVTTTGGFGSCESCTRNLSVVNTVASGNATGMAQAGAGATMNVSSSVATNNSDFGLDQVFGGTLKSALNNILTNNASGPTSGTISSGGILF